MPALTLDDFELLARERLPHMVYEFVASGTADEVTLRWNRKAFQRIALRPRVLHDVSRIDTSATRAGALPGYRVAGFIQKPGDVRHEHARPAQPAQVARRTCFSRRRSWGRTSPALCWRSSAA